VDQPDEFFDHNAARGNEGRFAEIPALRGSVGGLPSGWSRRLLRATAARKPGRWLAAAPKDVTGHVPA
jgi:hypothetical protein